jgi:hypothetical protein
MRSAYSVMMVLLLLLGGCTSASTVTSDGKEPDVNAHIYKQDYETVFLQAVDAVNAMKWQITFADKGIGIISAKTPTSLWSWGDQVAVKVRDEKGKGVKVDVSAGTDRQVVDWGHNKRNITGFYQKLDQLLNR